MNTHRQTDRHTPEYTSSLAPVGSAADNYTMGEVKFH